MGGVLTKSLIQFFVDGWAVFPPCCLTWDQAMVEVMKIMGPPSKGPGHTLAHSVPPNPAAGHSPPTSLLEPPGHSQASLGQSLVRSLLLSLRAQCPQGFICALYASVSPGLCKFYNQIPLASKVKFPGGSQFLFQIPRLGNLLWALELS